VAVVDAFPDDDDPRFFGLPANITFSWELTESRLTLAQLRHLHVDETAATKFNRDAWNTALSPVLSLWKKLNQVAILTISLKDAPYSKNFGCQYRCETKTGNSYLS
jgi:hypothetical protein